MKLHLDKPAFETLLLSESESAGIRADILEKDYYRISMRLYLILPKFRLVSQILKFYSMKY